MKTEDGYFRGFPALWNVAAMYLMIVAPAQWIATAIVLLLVALIFAPILVVHPFRARDHRISGPVLAIGWVISTSALLLPDLSQFERNAALASSTVSLLALLLLGVARTFRGPKAI